MDLKLLAWGLRRRGALPRLWLFTDERRLPDPIGAVRRLPRGRAGVVFRHDGASGRAVLGRAIGRICRDRRLTLVVAGDARLARALRAGVHLRGGTRATSHRPQGVITSSAHSLADVWRAVRAGADLVFLSPAFPTASHPGAPGLGPVQWGKLSRRAPAGARLAALGGVTGANVRRLPARACYAVGAIGALAP